MLNLLHMCLAKLSEPEIPKILISHEHGHLCTFCYRIYLYFAQPLKFISWLGCLIYKNGIQYLNKSIDKNNDTSCFESHNYCRQKNGYFQITTECWMYIHRFPHVINAMFIVILLFLNLWMSHWPPNDLYLYWRDK